MNILKKMKGLSSQNQTVIFNMFGAFLVKGFSLCLSLVTMPAYIRYFHDQTILGIWYTIIAVLNWVMYFDLGLGNGLRNKLPKAIEENDTKKEKEYISTTYITMSVLALVLLLIGSIAISHLNWNAILNVPSQVAKNNTLATCVAIVFAGIMLQFIVKIVASVLYALQKSAIVNLLTLCSSSIILISLYIMPSSTMEINLWRMAIVNVVAMTVPYIVASFIVYIKMLPGTAPRIKFFRKVMVSSILKIGVSLLWLSLVFMIISSTNEFLISYFTAPEYVVEYQAYYKVFKTGAMIFSLALTPIWSAVTKAQANNNYNWIIKVYKIFLLACGGCLILELLIVPFLQPIMNIWLGKGTIIVNYLHAIAFCFSGTIMIVHNVNSSIGNGISYFKVQMIWMTFAAVVDIPLSYLFVQITGGWIGVVIANILALLPFNVLAPFFTIKKLKQYLINSENDKNNMLIESSK